MKKIILDNTDKSLEILLDTAPALPLQFTTSWADATDTTLVESSSHGTIPAATATTLVSAPAASVRRGIVDYSVYNPNSIASFGSLLFRESGNTRIITRFRLSPNETLTTDGVFTASGRQRVDNGGGDREVLSNNRTYFVRTDGNDANTGLANTASGAFLTIQKAIDVVVGLDLSIFDVTIQLANGTYAGFVVLKPFIGSGKIIIQGNFSSPASVVVNSATAGSGSGLDATIFCQSNNSTYELRDFRVGGTGADLNAITCFNSFLQFGNLDFGQATKAHLLATEGGKILCLSNYSISAAAERHYWANSKGIIRVQSKAITLSGSQNYSLNFAAADYDGLLVANGNTYTGGTVTGSRYTVFAAGFIVALGGANYFPGSIAGTPVPGATEAQIHAVNYGQYQ